MDAGRANAVCAAADADEVDVLLGEPLDETGVSIGKVTPPRRGSTSEGGAHDA